MNYKNPFIRVVWEDTPENITQEKIKRVKEYFKKKYNTNNVKIVRKTSYNTSDIKLKSIDNIDNILDYQYQKKIVKEYIDNSGIKVNYSLLNKLDDKVNSNIDIINEVKVRYNKWYIKKIEFSNFLCFGEDNVIDFENLDGITIVESRPKNFGGKCVDGDSTFIDIEYNEDKIINKLGFLPDELK